MIAFPRGGFCSTRTYSRSRCLKLSWTRELHYDGRIRLSNFWTAPPTSIDKDVKNPLESGHSLLVKGGYVRQAHAGIFHFLPLGLRVQTKLENLVDKHMRGLGASKLSLSSISTVELWVKSGRASQATELLHLRDRNNSKLLLSPTHEEEITTLVHSFVSSYKHLPLRLYQVTRKYRDEVRPRQGLLRAKEFLMKDLYTFDSTEAAALDTYREVLKAYIAFFEELGLEFSIASADSGNMGGSLSHEFHLKSPVGEDEILSCDQPECGYVANIEVVQKKKSSETPILSSQDILVWTGVSRDRLHLVHVFLPDAGKSSVGNAASIIDYRALKEVFPFLDLSLDEKTDAKALWDYRNSKATVVHAYDYRVSPDQTSALQPRDGVSPDVVKKNPTTKEPLDFIKVQAGSSCPQCEHGKLSKDRAIEIGHTFHLGARYSEPLNAKVAVRTSTVGGATVDEPMQMGCHGIGMSRLIGAIASICSDQKGIKWPRVIAPFDAIIIARAKTNDSREAQDAVELYDRLIERTNSSRRRPLDLIIDDSDKSMGVKFANAGLMGCSYTVTIGNYWREEGKLEVIDAQTRDRSFLTEDELFSLLHQPM